MSSDHRISIDNGKYTLVALAGDYRVGILREGLPWVDPQVKASCALRSLMCELDAARVVVQAARAYVERRLTALDLDSGDPIARALAWHDRLTSDRTPPSGWTNGRQMLLRMLDTRTPAPEIPRSTS